ncbi:probable phytol kinase 1, chloroplastic isoform X2 [Dioscorea cayenensis subsp. rotundata]|uniref:phytol kinase n=1 Tax=Dioscorea cayennensis subsp. rotundata TaxID=55577 RepID=A0AB40BM69_DIOCR|nr:probable phytol kinase 1, chloroplastic isoform X2 [Dioscorea cayenensis subsp. rotundata]
MATTPVVKIAASPSILTLRFPRKPLLIPSDTGVFRRPSSLRLRRIRSTAVASWLQDSGATVAVLSGAYSLVLSFDFLTKMNLIEQNLSRKLVHVLSGVLFMSSWPIFSSTTEARYFAAIVPFINCLRLVSYGLGLFTNEDLIKSVTREGKPEELLQGPLCYVLVLLVCTLFFWHQSPIGIVSIAMMSGGDGFADIVGRRFGTLKLPYNKRKSWIGSISMFTFGFLFSIGMLYYFSIFGYLHLEWMPVIKKVAIISFAATMVESLPIDEATLNNPTNLS